nr:uncharacterized protein LOC126520905 isoform X1 [Dermacentor andersoni]
MPACGVAHWTAAVRERAGVPGSDETTQEAISPACSRDNCASEKHDGTDRETSKCASHTGCKVVKLEASATRKATRLQRPYWIWPVALRSFAAAPSADSPGRTSGGCNQLAFNRKCTATCTGTPRLPDRRIDHARGRHPCHSGARHCARFSSPSDFPSKFSF